MEKPLIGISTCLLGENVRYDGGHALDRYLRDKLGGFVDYIAVCPEVDCGLNTPREAMRLVEVNDSLRLLTQKTGIDLTGRLTSWMDSSLRSLSKQALCGFVFKSKSPSSGMRDVKRYNRDGQVTGKGAGLFAAAFMEMFPLVPVEDEGRLNDDKLRENFIERVFVFWRWHRLTIGKKSIAALQNFHAAHKYLIMAHNPSTLKSLGALIAKSKLGSIEAIYTQYVTLLMPALKYIATVKKNTDVLFHLMGYFKKHLTMDEKAELSETIGRYHAGLTPLLVPLTLINHYVRKFKPVYLADQYYLNPHPLELKLRNHY